MCSRCFSHIPNWGTDALAPAAAKGTLRSGKRDANCTKVQSAGENVFSCGAGRPA